MILRDNNITSTIPFWDNRPTFNKKKLNYKVVENETTTIVIGKIVF